MKSAQDAFDFLFNPFSVASHQIHLEQAPQNNRRELLGHPINGVFICCLFQRWNCVFAALQPSLVKFKWQSNGGFTAVLAYYYLTTQG